MTKESIPTTDPTRKNISAQDFEAIIVEAFAPITFFATILEDSGDLSARPGARGPEIGAVLAALDAHCYTRALEAFEKASQKGASHV